MHTAAKLCMGQINKENNINSFSLDVLICCQLMVTAIRGHKLNMAHFDYGKFDNLLQTDRIPLSHFPGMIWLILKLGTQYFDI